MWKQKTSHLPGTMSDSPRQVVGLVVLGSHEEEARPLPGAEGPKKGAQWREELGVGAPQEGVQGMRQM